jgi:hypothetical protein
MQNFPDHLGLGLDLSDNYSKYMSQKLCLHSPAMIIGSSDKLEISDLKFQMHFPPISWLGKPIIEDALLIVPFTFRSWVRSY